MSDCRQQIHHAIQSYDNSDLKWAVSSLPEPALLNYERRELRDTVVSVAIRAYYDPAELTSRITVFRYPPR